MLSWRLRCTRQVNSKLDDLRVVQEMHSRVCDPSPSPSRLSCLHHRSPSARQMEKQSTEETQSSYI